MQRSGLARHASNVLAQWSKSHSALEELANSDRQDIRITSSAAYGLLRLPPQQQDDTVRWLNDTLTKQYPDYLGSDAARDHWLEELSGMARLAQDMDAVRQNRQRIFAERIKNYTDGQEGASRALLLALQGRAQERKSEFERTDLAELDKEIAGLKTISEKATDIANLVFSEYMEGVNLDTTKALRNLMKSAHERTNRDAKNAEGSYSTRVTKEKDGLLSLIARKCWGGGTEICPVTIQTIDASTVKNSILDFRDFLQIELKDEILRANLRWRNEVASHIIGRLRESIGDQEVSGDAVRAAIRSVLLRVRNIPGPTLSDIPEGLAPTGKLEGSKKDAFIKEAEDYLTSLKDQGNDFAKLVGEALKLIEATAVGGMIFEQLRTDLNEKKEQLQNKRVTAERYDRLLSTLIKESAA